MTDQKATETKPGAGLASPQLEAMVGRLADAIALSKTEPPARLKLRTLLLASCLLCSTVFDVDGQVIWRTSFWNPLPSPLLPIARDGKMGYIDRDGKLVIEPRFSIPSFMGDKLLTGFSDGLARIKEHDRWGYIDLSGKVVIEPQFDEADKFSEGLAAVKSKGKWGYIDKAGQFVAAPQFGEALPFSEGLAAVAKGGKWGYIDKAGKFVVTPQLDAAAPFKDGVASVRLGRQYAHLDTSGKVIGNCANECAGQFHEGLAVVRTLYHFGEDPKHGYMNKKGEIVIDLQFDDAGDFHEGLAWIKFRPRDERERHTTEKLFYYIDHAGNRLTKESYFWTGDFSEGLAAVQPGKWDKRGYIDKTGRLVIQPKYDWAGTFSDGVAPVWVGSKWGYINKSGEFIWGPSK